MSFSYGKNAKLKSKKTINELFSKGTSISAYPLLLIYKENNTGLQAGVSVSKKRFKLAVDRNKIKRLLREAYRLNKGLLVDNSVDNYSFMILYLGKELPHFNLVDTKTKMIFNKFISKTTKKE